MAHCHFHKSLKFYLLSFSAGAYQDARRSDQNDRCVFVIVLTTSDVIILIYVNEVAFLFTKKSLPLMRFDWHQESST